MAAVVAALAGCGESAAGPSRSDTSAPESSSPGPPQRTSAPRYAFPVDGRTSYGHIHAIYPATDIFASCGATVRSPVDGFVLELNRTDRFTKAAPDGAAKGGLFVSIRGVDGVRYYGSHLGEVAATLRPGAPLRAGEQIGRLGRTGNANNVCHLHLALSPPCGNVGDWWVRRGAVYPWSYLDSWRTGGQRSPAPEVTAWQQRHGCPPQPRR